jgi:hypothetical protein
MTGNPYLAAVTDCTFYVSLFNDINTRLRVSANCHTG